MEKPKRNELIAQLNELIGSVPQDKRVIAHAYVKELEFMAATLDKLKSHVNENGAVELFVNGKQQMWRESPAMKTYNVTVQRYTNTFKAFTELLPGESKAMAGEALAQFIGNYPKMGIQTR